VAVAPHHDGGPIGTAAAIHLAACLPNFVLQETPFTAGRDTQARAAIAPAGIEKPTDGFFALPTGPGLGFDPGEKALNEYRERQA
jgi:galactonate dehydratase